MGVAWVELIGGGGCKARSQSQRPTEATAAGKAGKAGKGRCRRVLQKEGSHYRSAVQRSAVLCRDAGQADDAPADASPGVRVQPSPAERAGAPAGWRAVWQWVLGVGDGVRRVELPIRVVRRALSLGLAAPHEVGTDGLPLVGR